MSYSPCTPYVRDMFHQAARGSTHNGHIPKQTTMILVLGLTERHSFTSIPGPNSEPWNTEYGHHTVLAAALY